MPAVSGGRLLKSIWYACRYFSLAGAVILAVVVGDVDMDKAKAADTFRDFTLHHPRQESRTRWRIPETYLSDIHFLRGTEEPTTIISMQAVLPDLSPWRVSGLNPRNENDAKRYVSIDITPSHKFSVENEILPRMLREDLEITEEQGDFFRYRRVQRNAQGEVVDILPGSRFYVIPKKQLPHQATIFRCEKRCRAQADFSENVVVQYDLDLSLLTEWRAIDRKIRSLLANFIVL
jgi:hypothetical protein